MAGPCQPRLLPALVFLCSIATPSFADDGKDETERSRIRAVLERAFEAIATQDPAIWHDILVEDGIVVSFRADPAAPGGISKRLQRNVDFLAGLKPDERHFRERFTAEPTILIRGPMAVLWGEYDFRIDGVFSHCGIDSADLAKIEGEWKIVNMMWTVETTDCPTAQEPAPIP